jgi:transcriptional regulator with XRE-family HTH domain
MSLDMCSFGSAVASARKNKGWSQKELAAKIIKEEDQAPITPQYLNDIEHNRRSPTSTHLVKQFARVLDIDAEILFAVIGMLPEKERKLVNKSTPDGLARSSSPFVESWEKNEIRS